VLNLVRCEIRYKGGNFYNFSAFYHHYFRIWATNYSFQDIYIDTRSPSSKENISCELLIFAEIDSFSQTRMAQGQDALGRKLQAPQSSFSGPLFTHGLRRGPLP